MSQPMDKVIVTLVHGEPIKITAPETWTTFQRAIDAQATWVTFITADGDCTIRMEHVAAILRVRTT